MIRKALGAVLIVLILLCFAESARSGQSWGIRTIGNDPIIITAPAHPWGEQASRSAYSPPSYRGGSGYGFGGGFYAPAFTNFVTRFFLDYVVKQKMGRQTSLWHEMGSK